MRSLTAFLCILYFGINLLTHEVEGRGGKGGTRGYNNRYNAKTGSSSGSHVSSLSGQHGSQ